MFLMVPWMRSIWYGKRKGYLAVVLCRERSQFQACQRDGFPQTRKPFGHLRLRFPCFGAPAQQQHDRRPMLRPVASEILEHIQDCVVRPLEVIDKDKQRYLCG